MTSAPGVRMQRYRSALLAYLRRGPEADIADAIGLASGVSAGTLAQVHDQTVADSLAKPGMPWPRREAKRRARQFMIAAMLPRRWTASGDGDLPRLVATMVERGPTRVELAAAEKTLRDERAARKTAERALKVCKVRHHKLEERSDRLHRSQRDVYRRILVAQEEDRKQLSRELHDVIAQSLTSINLRLAGLKTQAERSAKGVDRSIAVTQKLVAESVAFVQRFARELRPAMLDDLGLIPALKDLMKDVTVRTGLHVHLAVCASVEELGPTRRTVLYRVAQEAMTNIVRHAKAGRVKVCIRETDGWFRMTIHDDGRSFSVARALQNKRKRLGLLCMRERLEMVGGSFGIESSPGVGTTLSAGVPAEGATAHLTRRRSPGVKL